MAGFKVTGNNRGDTWLPIIISVANCIDVD